MADIISLEQVRRRRGLPLPRRRDVLENCIAALMARIDRNPELVAEIVWLRNEIWLEDTKVPSPGYDDGLSP